MTRKKQQRLRIPRWLPWALLTLVSVSASVTDILMMRYTKHELDEQAKAITALQQVAVAQYGLFEAHVKQCSCSCSSVDSL